MERDALTHSELLALAALLQDLVRSNRLAVEEQSEAALAVGERLAKLPDGTVAAGSPYRGRAPGPEPLSRPDWIAIWEEAARRYTDTPAVDEALLAIERREAQEVIYGIAGDVARCGTATADELATLDWLARTWELE